MRRHGLFDARVPRYTSYPTANHFDGSVGPETMGKFLNEVPENAEISLYLHIPFCRRLCWFCACRTQGTSNIDPVKTYLSTLKDEIRLVTKLLPPDVSFSRVHWGGGTPTLLTPEMIAELADAVFEMAPMAPGGEFSVEIGHGEEGTPVFIDIGSGVG